MCPACAETIKVAAKVCPHCRHPQRWWSVYNPQAVATLWMAVCVAALIALGVFFERMFGHTRNFNEYRDQIAVVESKFSHRMSGTNLLITVVGVLTNRSDFTWKDVGIEAQFFDKQGGLIDVVSRVGDYGGVTLPLHADAGFKIEGKAAHPESDYGSHKVFVRWAKDVDAWP